MYEILKFCKHFFLNFKVNANVINAKQIQSIEKNEGATTLAKLLQFFQNLSINIINLKYKIQ